MKKLSFILIICFTIVVIAGCNSKIEETPGIIYTINEEGTAYIVTGYDGDSQKVNIASEHEGLPVTKIGIGAFKSATITSVYIPNSIQIIESHAFYINENLQEVKIQEKSSKLITIQDSAFDGCHNLSKINLPEGLQNIGVAAFSFTNLKSINIPSTVKSLSNIYLPKEGVTDRSAFIQIISLTEINVNKKNKYYSSVDGVLFNKDQTVLMIYPAGKSDPSYEVPSTVKEIASFAFYTFIDTENKLSSVKLPNGLEKIGFRAFEGNTFESIVIPASLGLAWLGAFQGCDNLTIYCEQERGLNNFSTVLPNIVYFANEWSYVNGEPTPND